MVAKIFLPILLWPPKVITGWWTILSSCDKNLSFVRQIFNSFFSLFNCQFSLWFGIYWRSQASRLVPFCSRFPSPCAVSGGNFILRQSCQSCASLCLRLPGSKLIVTPPYTIWRHPLYIFALLAPSRDLTIGNELYWIVLKPYDKLTNHVHLTKI